MDKEYIVKNCPSYRDDCTINCGGEDPSIIICEECTNCIIKQVIEKCKSLKVYDPLAIKILQLFEIEEIE